jgi:hypothetical protein
MVVSLKTFVDLKFGDRLLGVPLVEEIGEVFEDWHWNRQLAPDFVATEQQLTYSVVTADAFAQANGKRYEDALAMTEPERLRFRVASQWYWRADAETDPVTRFIQLWLVVESLEMFRQKLVAVTKRLMALIGERDEVRQLVVRLYKVRNDLVHGEFAMPASEDLEKMDAVARLLLKARIGEASASNELERIQRWTTP